MTPPKLSKVRSAMHVTKSLVYGRYALLDLRGMLLGLALGMAMVVGSWTGRKVIERHPEQRLGLVIEVLLAAAGLTMLIGSG